MDAFERMESEWRAAVEGMTFFGEPVQDMTAERMLVVVGNLVTENNRLKDEIRSVFTPGQQAMVQAISRLPVRVHSQGTTPDAK